MPCKIHDMHAWSYDYLVIWFYHVVGRSLWTLVNNVKRLRLLPPHFVQIGWTVLMECHHQLLKNKLFQSLVSIFVIYYCFWPVVLFYRPNGLCIWSILSSVSRLNFRRSPRLHGSPLLMMLRLHQMILLWKALMWRTLGCFLTQPCMHACILYVQCTCELEPIWHLNFYLKNIWMYELKLIRLPLFPCQLGRCWRIFGSIDPISTVVWWRGRRWRGHKGWMGEMMHAGIMR